MLSFQDQYQLCQSLTQDFTTGGKTLFQQLINNFQREVETEIGSFITEKQSTFNSITNLLPGETYKYPTPPDMIRLKLLWCTVGNSRYIATPVYNETEWQQYFFSNTSVSSNFLSRVMERKDTLEVYPVPSTSTTMNIVYEASRNDLTADDYSTGAISSVTTTSGVTTVVGQSSPAWTASMVGRFIQFTGDSQWYKLFTNADSTHFTLKTPYIGPLTSFSGIGYKIGELPPTPGDTHIIPVYGALSLYYLGPKKDTNFQKMYSGLYATNLARAKGTYGNRYSNKVITPSMNQLRQGLSRNPNYYPSNIGP